MLEWLKQRKVYHVLIWGFIALFFIMIDLDEDRELKETFYDVGLIILPLVFLSYGSFYAKSLFFEKRKYLYFFLSLILISTIGVLIFEVFRMIDINEGNSILQNATNVVFIQLFAIGLQYFKRGLVNQAQLQELRAKTAETELNALKSQINPHFLFNTLNNIYGMNQIDSSKGSEMILELSDVMRYHLEFSKAGSVRLEDEIQLTESYIRLESLRLTSSCDVQIDTSDTDGNLRVSPLLFLPFVENAFKHGTHPTKASFVYIKFATQGDSIIFECSNSLMPNRKVVKTNIGLENTRRRLELIYPEKHELKVETNDESYDVNLKIQL